jgi:hypothetical protein
LVITCCAAAVLVFPLLQAERIAHLNSSPAALSIEKLLPKEALDATCRSFQQPDITQPQQQRQQQQAEHDGSSQDLIQASERRAAAVAAAAAYLASHVEAACQPHVMRAFNSVKEVRRLRCCGCCCRLEICM